MIAKIGRNEPCPCGSGKKSKRCCHADARFFGQSIPTTKPVPKTTEINLLLALYHAGRYAELEIHARSLIQRYPDSGFAWKALGSSLHQQGKKSLHALQMAAKFLPNDANAHNDLGIVLAELGQLAAAAASYRQALKINPNYPEAHNNLGNIQRELLQLDDAVASYRRALAIKSDYAEAHSNLAYALLAMGKFPEGWHEYEFRWEGSSKPQRPVILLPQWTGQDVVPMSRLLICEEQGFGDKIQFSRYLPLAANRFVSGVSCVIGRPLQALFRRSFPNIEILDAVPDNQNNWQWQCPLLSLPLAFGTSLDNIPDGTPYLIPDPMRVAYWQSKIAALALPKAMRKIGVVWKSGNLMKIAHLKGLPLKHLAPLLNLPGCAWFSLQKEPDSDKAPWIDCGKLIDWTDDICDFDETAALLMNMDLVISVDTSVAHLAAALGRPTWLLNRKASDWRWMQNREDSPWYPTMRLFTQQIAGDWEGVVKRIAKELSEWTPTTAVMF